MSLAELYSPEDRRLASLLPSVSFLADTIADLPTDAVETVIVNPPDEEFKEDRLTGGAEAYTYLGTASYVKHEGSKPMNITWKLDAPIPAKYLKKTNKLVVG